MAGGEGGGLGRTVAVDDLRRGQRLLGASHVRDRQRLATDQQLLHTAQGARVVVEKPFGRDLASARLLNSSRL